MLARLAAAFIIIFWIAMMGLLVRNEFGPENSALNRIPPAHVLKVFFLRNTPSLLQIYSDRRLVGQVSITPRTDPRTMIRTVEFDGRMSVRLANGTRPGLTGAGVWTMDRGFQTRHLRLGLGMQDPLAGGAETERRADVEIDPVANRAHVVLQAQGEIDTRDYTLDENGARDFFRDLGVDPTMMAALTAQKSTLTTEVHARLSSIKIRDERVETYLVTIEQAGQTLAEIYVNQAGQILKVTTMLGYQMAAVDVD